MINFHYLNLILIFSLSPMLASATQEIPDEFKELYSKENRVVDFKGINGRYHKVLLLAGYDSIKITDEAEEKKLRQFLNENKIESFAVDHILSALANGKVNSDICEGEISECNHTPNDFEIYYDYFENKAYLFLNPELIIQDKNISTEYQFANPEKKDWSIINHFHGYSSLSNAMSAGYSFYDNTILGLPYGEIHSDIYYQSASDNFDLNDLYYNLEVDNFRYVAGLLRDQLSMNSTDFLYAKHNNREISFTLGTSKNMILGAKRASQKIFYFSPNAGVLTVYRGDRIILQKNIPSGQGFITNDELPSGRYNAVFEVKSGDEIVSQEVNAIYNTGNDVLAIEDFDTSLSVGVFDNLYDIDDAYDLAGDLFFRSLLTYRPIDEIVIGGGGIYSARDSSFTAGLKAYLPWESELTLNGQYFSNHGRYFDSLLSIRGMSLSYENFYVGDNSLMARYFYGNNSYTRASISKGFRLMHDSQAFITYSLFDNHGEDEFSSFRSSILTFGASKNIFNNARFQVNVDYDFEVDSLSNRFSTQLVLSIPLGRKLTAESRLALDGRDISSWNNSLHAENILDSIEGAYGSVVIDHNYLPDQIDHSMYDFSLHASHNHEYYNASVYGYTNSRGAVNGSANISSTQIISKNGVTLTNHESDAYLVVDSQGRLINDQNQGGVKGFLILESDDTTTIKKMVTHNTEVIPLRDYQSYKAFIETESVDLDNIGESYVDLYSTPGTVQYIKTDVSRVLSFVSAFRDIFDAEVKDVICDGEGCVDSNEIVSGVYKISVKEGQPFKLVNKDLVCYIPSVDNSEMYNFGHNYCLPQIEPTEQYITRQDNNTISITFVGGFDKAEYNNYLDHKIVSMTKRGDTVIKKQVGNFVYVYLQSEGEILTANQRDLILDVQRYTRDTQLLDNSRSYVLVKR